MPRVQVQPAEVVEAVGCAERLGGEVEFERRGAVGGEDGAERDVAAVEAAVLHGLEGHEAGGAGLDCAEFGGDVCGVEVRLAGRGVEGAPGEGCGGEGGGEGRLAAGKVGFDDALGPVQAEARGPEADAEFGLEFSEAGVGDGVTAGVELAAGPALDELAGEVSDQRVVLDGVAEE